VDFVIITHNIITIATIVTEIVSDEVLPTTNKQTKIQTNKATDTFKKSKKK